MDVPWYGCSIHMVGTSRIYASASTRGILRFTVAMTKTSRHVHGNLVEDAHCLAFGLRQEPVQESEEALTQVRKSLDLSNRRRGRGTSLHRRWIIRLNSMSERIKSLTLVAQVCKPFDE